VVLFNLFTALYGTRVIYDYLHAKRWLQKVHFLQIIHNPRIDFIGLRRAAFLLSGVLVTLGLLVAYWRAADNYDGSLALRLKGRHQPVIRTPKGVFNTPLDPFSRYLIGSSGLCVLEM
jgi:hypothetical protein